MLDDYEPQSLINKSPFMGMYNCVYTIMVFYFITTPLLRYKEKGEFIDNHLLMLLQRDFLLVAITWPLVPHINNNISFIYGVI